MNPANARPPSAPLKRAEGLKPHSADETRMRLSTGEPPSRRSRPTHLVKKYCRVFPLLLALLAAKAAAQTIVLDDFTTGVQAGEGSVIGGSTWVGQVTQSATTITIGGTARDDNGWRASGLTSFDASAMQFITVTGLFDPTNAATSFNVEFVDVFSATQAFSISSSAFTSSMTTVNIPIGAWSGIDPTQLNGWTIGGGNFATTGPVFRMTLDQLALTSAIPEPATAALLAGVVTAGFAWWRRRARPSRMG